MSREETIAYGERCGIPAPVSKKSPYSIDLNLLGRSIEAGSLEDPDVEPPEEIYAMTSSVEAAPATAELVEIRFEQGNPIAINGIELDPVHVEATGAVALEATVRIEKRVRRLGLRRFALRLG